MSSTEIGAKGVGSVTTSSKQASEIVEKAKVESSGSSGSVCAKPQFTINGTVKAMKSPINDVDISGGGKSTTSGPNGAYSLTFDQGTTVTLTYSLAGFKDEERTIGPLTTNVTENLSLQRKQYSLSGRLVFGSETAQSVRVELHGVGSKPLFKLTSDTFEFKGIPHGQEVRLTVYTDILHLNRTPAEIVKVVTGNLTEQNFTYSAKGIKISGVVKDGEANLAGASVKLNGGDPFVTQGDGAYEFTGVKAGQRYVVSAEHKHFTFESTTLSGPSMDTAVNFAGKRTARSITGKVKFADDGLKKVTVKLATTAPSGNKTTTTGADGSYAFTGLDSGYKYTLSIDTNAAKYNVTSSPAAIDELSQDETGRDFDGAWRTYALSGNVKEQLKSSQINKPKIQLTLSGNADDSDTTDGAGNYAFTVPGGGTFVVTPDPLPPYTFAPTSATAANVLAATAKNFIATWHKPDGGVARNTAGTTTYGLDIASCPKCRADPMTHAASPLRDTQDSRDHCATLSSLIAKCQKGLSKMMVGVLVCDNNGTTVYVAAHSGGDDYPPKWDTKAETAGFVVAKMVDAGALITRAGNALANVTQTGNNEVGICAAPKLIQAANTNGWTPLAMTEMSLNLPNYTNGQTVSSCVTCQSIVAQMLCDR